MLQRELKWHLTQNRKPSCWSRWQRFARLSCFSFTIKKPTKQALCFRVFQAAKATANKARSARHALWWKAWKNCLLLASRSTLASRSPEKRVKIAPDVLQATPPKFNLNGGKGRNIAQCALFFSLKWHFETGKHSNVASLAVVSRGAMFSFTLDFLIYFSFYS